MKPYVDSEVGDLEAVIVHSPGPEIEAMSPQTAHEHLYNDIIPLSVVSREHATLKAFLSIVAKVYEVTDLLLEALGNEEARNDFVAGLAAHAAGPRGEAADRLRGLDPAGLVRAALYGLSNQRGDLESFLSDRSFDLLPLPNLYFMRDSSFVYRDRIFISAMAHPIRRVEALVMETIARYHPDLGAEGGPECVRPDAGGGENGPSFEGGDVLVVRPGLVVAGVSERTTPAAIDLLGRRLAAVSPEGRVTILTVILPRGRATIHLDMVFTLCDAGAALVYEPLIRGPRAAGVVRFDSGTLSSRPTWKKGLLEALSEVGVELQVIPCGGTDPLVREREQWLSGANTLAIAPGKVLGYDCNPATMEAFDKAGFTVREAGDFLSGRACLSDFRRVAIRLPGIELARGGGGVRCMTMPLCRRPLATI